MSIERIKRHATAIPLLCLLWLWPQPAQAQQPVPTSVGLAVAGLWTSQKLGHSHVSGANDAIGLEDRLTGVFGGQVELRWQPEALPAGLSVIGRLGYVDSTKVSVKEVCLPGSENPCLDNMPIAFGSVTLGEVLGLVTRQVVSPASPMAVRGGLGGGLRATHLQWPAAHGASAGSRLHVDPVVAATVGLAWLGPSVTYALDLSSHLSWFGPDHTRVHILSIAAGVAINLP